MKKKKTRQSSLKNSNKAGKRNKSRAKENKYKHLIGLGTIFLLGALIYSNSFNCSFQFDDTPNIVTNNNIHNLSDISALWNYNKTRFLSYLSFAVNYHFGELNVWGYHFINLSIHLINASLIYGLTLLIFSCPVLKETPGLKHKNVFALVVSLLFISHPLATQSVTYIVQRMSSMAALFYLLSLFLYVKARLSDKKYHKYLLFSGALFSALFAMLTKENSFTLPFALVLFELFFLQTKKISINFKDYRVILFLAAIFGFIAVLLLSFSLSIFAPEAPILQNDFRTITPFNYLFTQFSVILKYIQLLILPLNQNFDYDYPLSTSFFDLKTIMSFLVLVAIIIVGILQFKKNRIISFGIFWFFLTLSVESSIIPIRDLIFEHRTYLPSFGFFLILTSVVYSFLWNKHKNIAIAIFALIIGSNSILTYERNKIWKNEFTFWNDIVAKSPDKARPYNNRGMLLKNTNRHEEMYRDFSKAIELQPKYAGAYSNRGNVFKKELRYTEALRDFNKAIELRPFLAEPYNNKGSIYMKEKRYNEAIVDLSKAIELKSDFATAYANRGITYINLGQNDKACIDLQKAIELGFQQSVDLYNTYCR